MNSDREKLYDLFKETFLLLDFGDRLLFTQYDLTAPRFYALSHIHDNPGLSLRELSERMFCDKSNATRIVKGLEKDNYVYRRQHETDGRVYRLFLTEAGTAVYQQIVIAHRQFNHTRLSGIDRAEEEKVRGFLSRLNERLREVLEEAPQLP